MYLPVIHYVFILYKTHLNLSHSEADRQRHVMSVENLGDENQRMRKELEDKDLEITELSKTLTNLNEDYKHLEKTKKEMESSLIKSEDNQFYKKKKKPIHKSLNRSFSSGSVSSD